MSAAGSVSIAMLTPSLLPATATVDRVVGIAHQPSPSVPAGNMAVKRRAAALQASRTSVIEDHHQLESSTGERAPAGAGALPWRLNRGLPGGIPEPHHVELPT